MYRDYGVDYDIARYKVADLRSQAEHATQVKEAKKNQRGWFSRRSKLAQVEAEDARGRTN